MDRSRSREDRGDRADRDDRDDRGDRGDRGRSRSRSCSRRRGGSSGSGSPQRWQDRGGRRGRSFSGDRGRGGRSFSRRRGGCKDKGGKGKYKGDGKGKSKFDGKDNKGFQRMPEWVCLQCKTENHQNREECRNCQALRDRRSEQPPGAPPPPAPPPPGGNYAQGGYGPLPQGKGNSWTAPPSGAAYGYGQGQQNPPPYGYGPPAGRDYAMEKPAAYQAFLAYIRHGIEGIEVFLRDRMCQDHHVDDLLACLESFLGRTIARPWRIGRLDLARNGLTDDSVARIIERLKLWGLRVKRLDLDANQVGPKGLKALVEFVWNCPEAITEIGLAGNGIHVEVGGGGEDPVSALLRCLYNHPAYPVKIQSESGMQVVPFILRLSDNRIGDGKELLARIRDNGGPAHVHFRPEAEAYPAVGEVFLSVSLPLYEQQGDLAITAGDGAMPAAGGQATALIPLVLEDDVSDYYSDSGSEDEAQDTQAAASAPVLPPPAVATIPAAAVGSASDSYSDEDSESEVQQQPDNNEVEDAEMPEDMLKALDILEAANDAQESREREMQQVQSNAEPRSIPMQAPSPDVDAESESESAGVKAHGHAVPDPASPPQSRSFPPGGDGPADKSTAMDEDNVVTRQAERHQRDVPAVAAASKRRPRPPARAAVETKIEVSRLKPGRYADGKVTLVCERFALVECGLEVEGLLHVESLHGAHKNAGDALSIGDDVHVEVTGVCTRRRRVSLQQVDARDPGNVRMNDRPKRTVRIRKSEKRARQEAKRQKLAASAAACDAPYLAVTQVAIEKQLATATGKAKSRPKPRPEDLLPAAGAEDSFGEATEGTLSADEQLHLERDVIDRLDTMTDLNMDPEDKKEFAELVLAMLCDGKRPSEVETELAALMSQHQSAKFTSWLVEHVTGPWLRAARSRVGATPKSAPRKSDG